MLILYILLAYAAGVFTPFLAFYIWSWIDP